MSNPAAAFFAGCRLAFAEARRRTPGATHHLRLDGLPLTLHFAGERLAAGIAPALALQRTGSGAPDALSVELWDEAETGVAAPPAPWQGQPPGPDDAEGGRGLDLAGSNLKGRLAADGRLLWMLDLPARRALVWFRGASALPAWDLIHPLRGLLHAWLQAEGRLMLHAGTVGTPRGGVLVVGRGGAGKSTTVLAAIAGGLRSAGDDYAVVGAGPPWTAHALYGTMRLFADHASRFPGLLPATDRTDPVKGRDKLAADLQRHRPGALLPSLPLRAIVAPRVSPGERCRLEPLPPAAAILALAPSTLQQLNSGEASLRAMQRLCRTLPCRRLLLGDDPEAVAGLLGTLLTELEHA